MEWTQIKIYVILPLIVIFFTFIGNLIFKNRKDILLAFKKLSFRVFPVNFNIAFSLDFDEGLNSGNYFDQMKKNILKIINDANLSSQIKIKDCSNLRKFENKEQAEKFRNEKNIDLIIWGGFSNDNLKTKGEVVNKVNLSFTFGYPSQQGDNLGKLLQFDIKSKFAQKNYWQIFEKNSNIDIEEISNNIFNISTYILALTLKLYGKIRKSLVLFEQLKLKVANKDKKLHNDIVGHLINCYQILALEMAFKENNHYASIDYCNKILQLQPDSFFAITNLAVAFYKIGNLPESNKYVEILKKKYPNNTITMVDLAFIKILHKDYIGAYSIYCKLIKNKRVHFNPQEVVEFLNYEFEKSKEPAMLFASGLISYYWGDKQIAEADWTLFLKKAKSKVYNQMKNLIKKHLKIKHNH